MLASASNQQSTAKPRCRASCVSTNNRMLRPSRVRHSGSVSVWATTWGLWKASVPSNPASRRYDSTSSEMPSSAAKPNPEFARAGGSVEGMPPLGIFASGLALHDAGLVCVVLVNLILNRSCKACRKVCASVGVAVLGTSETGTGMNSYLPSRSWSGIAIAHGTLAQQCGVLPAGHDHVHRLRAHKQAVRS